MCAPILGKWIEKKNVLSLPCPPPACQVEVFLFDVEYDHRFLVVEKIGHHHAHTFTRSRRRREYHELLSTQAKQLAAKLAYNDAVLARLEQTLLLQIEGARETRIAVQRFPCWLQDGYDQGEIAECRQAITNVAAEPDPAGVGLVLRQVQRLEVPKVGVPRHQPGIKL